ncbi:MAG: virulence protein RhuM/Fic/DOC family protein [Patescibacteria group bacterium]
MKKRKKEQQNIVIYQSKSGAIELKGDFNRDTMWATQAQIVKLFGIDQSVVSRHTKNIFKDGEIEAKSNMQKMHNANSDKPITMYSLDVILAIGYRANSKVAIEFRKWATKTLRDYIIKGVAVNTERIKRLHERGIEDLRSKIEFIQNTIKKSELDKNEVDSLLSVIKDYANSWTILKEYDEGEILIKKSKAKEKKVIDYDFARSAIDRLKLKLLEKKEAGDLFGNERNETFKGILRTIYQTFGGKELYQSLEEKATHLLYFLIKDHPFSDGNKRIGSLLFILFLNRNKILHRKSGEKKISDNTLVALALLIAESNPNEKEIMIALVTNLLT